MSEKSKMVSVEGGVAPSLKSKFKSYCKKNHTSQSEFIRNAIQDVVKRKKTLKAA